MVFSPALQRGEIGQQYAVSPVGAAVQNRQFAIAILFTQFPAISPNPCHAPCRQALGWKQRANHTG